MGEGWDSCAQAIATTRHRPSQKRSGMLKQGRHAPDSATPGHGCIVLRDCNRRLQPKCPV
jgi:hypothetical protein